MVGGVTSLTLRGTRTPPPPPAPGSGKPPPPPPPSNAPRTGTPAKRAARERTRGDVAVRVEQQQQQQRAMWEVRAISAEAAQRDMEACLAKANEDRRAAEVERDALAATMIASLPR